METFSFGRWRRSVSTWRLVGKKTHLRGTPAASRESTLIEEVGHECHMVRLDRWYISYTRSNTIRRSTSRSKVLGLDHQ
jgi:hypothetical protein